MKIPLTANNPTYENFSVIQNFLQNSQNNEDQPDLNLPPPLPEKRKIGKVENLYENVNTSLQNGVSSTPDEKKDNRTALAEHNSNKGKFYRSTFSIVIGGKTSANDHENDDSLSSLSMEKNSDSNFDSIGTEECNEDGSFKSSYAKSLMDSYRRQTASPHPNPFCESTRIANPTVNESPNLLTVPLQTEHVTHQSTPESMPSFSISSNVSESKSIQDLELNIFSLNDRMNYKDTEINRLKQEIFSLKLARNDDQVSCSFSNLPSLSSIGAESSLTNISNRDYDGLHQSVDSNFDTDTWTLQQQIHTLNEKLKKAEFSRHAYESATKQLVNFLQTVNTTLNGISGISSQKNQAMDDNVQADTQAIEALSNIENVYMRNCSRRAFHKDVEHKRHSMKCLQSESLSMNSILNEGSSRELKNITSENRGKEACSTDSPFQEELNIDKCMFDVSSNKSKEKYLMEDTRSLDIINKYQDELINKIGSELLNKNHNASNRSRSDSASGHTTSSSTPRSSSRKECSEKFPRRESSSKNDAKKVKLKKERDRRSTMPLKLWLLKPELKRSESVSVITKADTFDRRVNRSVSSHNLALAESKTSKKNTPKPSSDDISNKLHSSKSKTFFSSLRNIFRADDDKSFKLQNTESSASIRKRLNPLSNRKVKSVNLDEEEWGTRVEVSEKHHQNSVFYVDRPESTKETKLSKIKSKTLCGSTIDLSSDDECRDKFDFEETKNIFCNNAGVPLTPADVRILRYEDESSGDKSLGDVPSNETVPRVNDQDAKGNMLDRSISEKTFELPKLISEMCDAIDLEKIELSDTERSEFSDYENTEISDSDKIDFSDGEKNDINFDSEKQDNSDTGQTEESNGYVSGSSVSSLDNFQSTCDNSESLSIDSEEVKRVGSDNRMTSTYFVMINCGENKH